MDKINKTLLSSFEERYQEFKDYSTFYTKFVETAKENLKEREEFILKNIDSPEAIENFILENSTLPYYYANDLEILKERLIATYEAVKDFIELPQEVIDDMFVTIKLKSKLAFKIVAGSPEPIDPNYIEQIKAEIKKQGIIKKVLEPLASK